MLVVVFDPPFLISVLLRFYLLHEATPVIAAAAEIQNSEAQKPILLFGGTLVCFSLFIFLLDFPLHTLLVS